MTKKKDPQVLKRHRVRGLRKNAERKGRRQILAKEKHKIMSRQKDIDNLTKDIESKQKELQGLQAKVQTYSQEATETITALLKKAKLFEKIHKLEEDRRVFQQEAQQKATTIQSEIQDLSKMRNWLVGQDKAEEESPVSSSEKADNDG